VTSNPAFERYVDRLIKTRYGTASALALAIGMSQSAFCRGVREEGTLSVENCLRLAEAIGERPGVILRLVHRDEMAVIADRLFGTTKNTLTRREREHLALWRTVDPIAHDAIDALLQTRADAAPASGTVLEAEKTRNGKATAPLSSKMKVARRRAPAGSKLNRKDEEKRLST
jgi:plasmid maintenance system antidote protein VapI